ncbi:hypothetical protein PENSPDRAFT_573133 [Peniophora sp. CONT]|nr:hypothetical protein PENSPDRAFT_573133 [Peniophora sp. CONT]
MSFRILRAISSLRTAHSPLRSRVLLSTRLASTTPSSSFPFPPGPNPTPWQIFHLPTNATQKDIKARYYELVRRYHPDSPFARSLPPETAHSQFQAVSRAYDMLRGRKSSMAMDDTSDGPATRPDNDVGFEIWKARQARKADIDVTFDERWKDKMLVGILLFVSYHLYSLCCWTDAS